MVSIGMADAEPLGTLPAAAGRGAAGGLIADEGGIPPRATDR
jgi:hypothetical protein